MKMRKNVTGQALLCAKTSKEELFNLKHGLANVHYYSRL